MGRERRDTIVYLDQTKLKRIFYHRTGLNEGYALFSVVIVDVTMSRECHFDIGMAGQQCSQFKSIVNVTNYATLRIEFQKRTALRSSWLPIG